MAQPVKIMAILAAKPGKSEALQQLLFGMVASCRAEPGNLRWDIWRDKADPDRFVLDELYVDADAVVAHSASPHFQTYASKIVDLADRTAIPLTPVAVA